MIRFQPPGEARADDVTRTFEQLDVQTDKPVSARKIADVAGNRLDRMVAETIDRMASLEQRLLGPSSAPRLILDASPWRWELPGPGRTCRPAANEEENKRCVRLAYALLNY